jgi:hypothetical protein
MGVVVFGEFWARSAKEEVNRDATTPQNKKFFMLRLPK